MRLGGKFLLSFCCTTMCGICVSLCNSQDLLAGGNSKLSEALQVLHSNNTTRGTPELANLYRGSQSQGYNRSRHSECVSYNHSEARPWPAGVSPGLLRL